MSDTDQAKSTIPPESLRGAIAQGRMNRKAWVVTGMLVLFQIINFADKAIIGLVAAPAMAELNLSGTQFGFIGSSFFFLFAISAIAVGFLAGRVSTRWILLVMCVAWAVLQFPILLGGGAAVLLVMRILLGAAEGPATPISLQHTHGWFPPHERGLPSSIVAAGSTLGPIIAAPALAWVIAQPALGWRAAFGVMGIVGLMWAIAWFLVGRDGPFSHTNKAAPINVEEQRPATAEELGESGSVADHSDRLQRVPFLRIVGTRMFVVGTLAGAGCFWAQGFLTTWAVKYLGGILTLGPEMVGLVSILPWVLGALTLMSLGYASRFLMQRGVTVRWALGALFGATLLISGVCFLLLTRTGGVLAVTLLTIAAGLALTFPLAPTAVAFCVASRQRAACMATLTAFASLGGVVAPFMVGFLMDRAGYVAQGKVDSPEMVELLKVGMNNGFTFIGIYLVIVGILSILLLNPDRTARTLQKKFVFNG